MKTLAITLRIPPGDLAVNGRLIPQYNRQGKPTGRLIESDKYRCGLAEAALVVAQERTKANWRTVQNDSVYVSVMTYWGGSEGDRDSTCKAVNDALQQGLVVRNDKQCGPILLDAEWNSEDPRVEIVVTHSPPKEAHGAP